MIRSLRRRHRAMSVGVALASAALLVAVPLARPSRTVGSISAERPVVPPPGTKFLRLEAELASGRLRVSLSIDRERGELSVLDSRGTTLPDVLLYHAATAAVEGLPHDARLLGSIATLVGEPARLPSDRGWIHAFSLGHATLAASLDLDAQLGR